MKTSRQKLLFALFALATLASCVSAPSQADMASKCVEYGLQPGAPEFALCKQNEMAAWQRQQDLQSQAAMMLFM